MRTVIVTHARTNFCPPLTLPVRSSIRAAGLGRIAGVMLLLSGILLLAGCGRGTTKLESPKAVNMWSLLRTACSSEDADKLSRAGEAVETAHAAGEITNRERQMFDEVLELGTQREWDKALQRLRKIHTLNF